MKVKISIRPPSSEPKPVKPPVASKPDAEAESAEPVKPVEPAKPVEPVKPKKPAGAVSMFGGVDLFGGSKSPPFSAAAAKTRVPVKPKGYTDTVCLYYYLTVLDMKVACVHFNRARLLKLSLPLARQDSRSKKPGSLMPGLGHWVVFLGNTLLSRGLFIERIVKWMPVNWSENLTN